MNRPAPLPATPAGPRPPAPSPSRDGRPAVADPSLDAAVSEAARLAAELGRLFDRLAPATTERPEARAASYRLQDAAFLCRRAAEELAGAAPGR